ncbi:MAG: Co2+/Mg2+ efflux protein ApaG [Deltaproteobacteria bacterium RIFCSPLOWO2_12_FULL_40_28]|nr:MAG: Co2+/Mg2+ efflux protein ApaG [Deltaproteobacteria bacterium RIFCSPHIGHO2_02_FULL_40_28]OGQ19226.1 MAG: Co2+/Mg2+ efflux protein ApaG [Deltaproteobacteria bacterium RIFCSPHIGHO2_12_FULL_40_32]OGQ40550.1 MAG: Co2+/Mg2+ efflux protein ApaG [Deltaproteobacteria bacterium RIFCSPLOWO2_02_FULL_40_36]OGQ53785.1 MAG: Co2+/Mg2+ efflux protein ApaG [Deltaproteobacteria bacterium RIFCSPLOWO2_12_FULL_40_28]
MQQAVTHGIRVSVETQYVEDESNSDESYYVFSYTITITNESDGIAQLMSRHWVITNADGKTEEVRGPGVVGQQPILAPGESFTYSSFCPLSTPIGSMYGTYQVVKNSTETLEVKIPVFSLAVPHVLH